jgi:arylesterase/paraoxonase
VCTCGNTIAGKIRPLCGVLVRKIGAIALILLVAMLLALVVLDGGFGSVTPHFEGSCRELPVEGSTEDVRLDERGVAYLSTQDRDNQGRGTIMLVDLNAAAPRPRAALAESSELYPLGLSLYTSPEGVRRLFVIDRRPDGNHRVAIHEQTVTGAFALVESVPGGSFLSSPNAIVAVGPRQFYVVNDFGSRSPYARLLELFFSRPRAYLTYFDGHGKRIVADRLRVGVGLTASPDGKHLYVSEFRAKRIRVFERDAASGDLQPRETLALQAAPDNLHFDSEGRLLIAVHPKLLTLVRAIRNPERRAPTQILRFDPRAPESSRVTEVFADDGARLSAGSVAVAHGRRMLIGSLADRKLLLCEAGGNKARTPAP